MKVTPLEIPGAFLIRPDVYHDARGSFATIWKEPQFAGAGLKFSFAQDSVSLSHLGVIRGLHFQHPNDQAKLVTVLSGSVFDVALDVRRGSSHFGRFVAVTLTSEPPAQLFLEPGFAHGYQALEDSTLLHYKLSRPHDPLSERVIRWNDPEIAIKWPIDVSEIAPRDAAAPRLSEIDSASLPAISDG
jgi:dTDP-4-dehydrorhamnose 3,5-epimerase